MKLEVPTLARLIGAQLEVDTRLVTPHARFIEDLKADPVRITDLMLALEEYFEIEISNDDAARLRTLDDVLGYLTTQGYAP